MNFFFKQRQFHSDHEEIEYIVSVIMNLPEEQNRELFPNLARFSRVSQTIDSSIVKVREIDEKISKTVPEKDEKIDIKNEFSGGLDLENNQSQDSNSDDEFIHKKNYEDLSKNCENEVKPNFDSSKEEKNDEFIEINLEKENFHSEKEKKTRNNNKINDFLPFFEKKEEALNENPQGKMLKDSCEIIFTQQNDENPGFLNEEIIGLNYGKEKFHSETEKTTNRAHNTLDIPQFTVIFSTC